MFFYGIIRWIVLIYFKLIYNFKLEGRQRLPQGGGYIIAPNHLHWADPLFVAVGIRCPSSYMAKESLFKIKPLVPLIKAFHAFPVKREQSDRSALMTAVSFISRGYNLTIFPEGTRSKDGRLGRGKSGVAFIASESGADVIPVGIRIEKKKWHRKYVTVEYGSSIPNSELKITGMSASQMRKARDLIMQRIGELSRNV